MSAMMGGCANRSTGDDKTAQVGGVMQGGSLLLAEMENVAAANKRQWMVW
jgi:hypothetical protein